MFNSPEFDGENRLYYEQSFHSQGLDVVAGVDEAGRGPLAGPVVAGCVVLTSDDSVAMYKDSKTLSESKRLHLYQQLIESSHVYGIGVSSAREIEKINIHQASLLAMKRAVDDCAKKIPGEKIDCLLVDGRSEVPMVIPQKALIKGESKSCSIAAASIIAKVTRDTMMMKLHEMYPSYNFTSNQGYPTLEHRKAIQQYGPCPAHRRTFKGVREYIRPENEGSKDQQQISLW